MTDKPSHHPDNPDPRYARALLTGTHSIDAVTSEFTTDGADDPIDLATVPREELADYEFSAIQPPAPIIKYLATDDPLTHEVINKIELAIQDHYRLPDPWYITAERTGTAGKDLAVSCFRLLCDLDKEKKGS